MRLTKTNGEFSLTMYNKKNSLSKKTNAHAQSQVVLTFPAKNLYDYESVLATKVKIFACRHYQAKNCA